MRAELKILVIDDEESISKTIKRALRMNGIDNVATAATYNEAIEYIKKNQPQIVISDINLPDGNGLTILKETKNIAPLTQVIMLSGKGDLSRVITALEAGAADFLRKPMDMNELEDIIEFSIKRVIRWADLYEQFMIESFKSK
jgi:DNA-binding NtrC family response regulator